MPSAGERDRERESTDSLARVGERSRFVRRESFVGCIPFPCKSCLYSQSQSRRTSELADTGKEAAERSSTGWRRSEIIVAQLVPWPHRTHAHVIVYNVRSRPKWRKKILDNNLLPALPHSVRIFHFQKLRMRLNPQPVPLKLSLGAPPPPATSRNSRGRIEAALTY